MKFLDIFADNIYAGNIILFLKFFFSLFFNFVRSKNTIFKITNMLLKQNSCISRQSKVNFMFVVLNLIYCDHNFSSCKSIF